MIARFEKSRRYRPLLALGLAAGGLLGLARPASADEGGASVYLLGAGGPGTAIMPPVKGVFFSNALYYYSGEAGGDKQFPICGSVVADLNAAITADFATVLWVPSTDFAGGTLALGAALPVGEVDIDVSGVISARRPFPKPSPRAFSSTISGRSRMIPDPARGWAPSRARRQASASRRPGTSSWRSDPRPCGFMPLRSSMWRTAWKATPSSSISRFPW